MKENFMTALELTLKYEGGFVWDKHDPGGPTNMGITIATLSHELGHQATVTEVRNLSRNTAANIYRKKYWNVVGGDKLPNGVDILAFDIAVNSGPGRALLWLDAVRGKPVSEQIRLLDERRRSFYKGLKTFWRFGKGWMAREKDLFSHAVALADGKKYA